jgi:TonB-linked SusC/RagA family outer membrane protein
MPLSGVAIKVNGEQVAATSDKGIFSVDAEKNATLLLSKIGYISVSLKANNSTQYLILQKNPLLVNQAVAYGNTKRGAITSSMSIVDGDKLNNSVSALGSALYGKLPGLFMQQGQGEPGDDQPLYYFIRGSITFGSASNQPMVFVDGFERDLNSIQVEDVENIAVLKDAAATAIYGARGANGVIQVTTKRGHEGKIKVNANVQYGMQSATRIPDFLSSYDYSMKYRKAYETDGLNMTALPARYTDAKIENYKTGDPYYYPNIDWIAEMTKPSAPRRQADINVSGGNKIGRYFVSLNYNGVDGLFKHTESPQNWSSNSKLDRYRFRSNIDVNITKNWTLRADLSGQIDTKNRPMLGSGGLWNALYKAPTNLFPIYSAEKVYGGSSSYTSNPMAEAETKGYQSFRERCLMSNIETKYDLGEFVKGLQVGLRFGYDNTYTNRSGWQRSYQVADVLGQDSVTKNPILGALVGTNSNLTYFGPDSDGQNDRMTFEGFADYNRLFDNKHNITSMLMYHQDAYILDGDPKAYKYQFVGGRLGYDFKSKYFTDFSFSYSGTENFTKKNRFGFFPALSAGWMISQEDFMKSATAVDYLKLRASAGMVGNSAVGERFTYVQQYVSNTGWVFGNTNTSAGGLSEGTFPNENFSFETAYKYEVGLESKFLKMLSVWANVYLEHRTNILTTSSSLVPGVFGGSLANVNAGITERKGLEFGINFDKQQKDWGFHLGLNGSYNINKILKINEEPKVDEYLNLQGTELGQPFMLESLGFFKDQAEIDDKNTPVQTYGDVKPGDLKYKDQNGDGKIDDNDKKAFFNGFRPKAEFGLDLSVNFKGFEVAAFFQSQVGRSVYLGDNAAIFWPLQSGSARISTYAANSWTPETAETADYPRLTTVTNSNNYRASTFWYRNGNFIRLRNLEIGYTLPQAFTQSAKIAKAKIFVRGINLFTWDHIKVVDPEVLSGYPVMKSYNVGLNIQL